VKRLIFCIILLSFASATDSLADEPAYREIRASFTYGVSVPTGNCKELMERGQGLTLDLGMALSSRTTVGFHFGFGVFDTKFERIGPLDAATSGNDWMRFVGGVFGEYLLAESRVAPFVGANVGVHAVYVAYAEAIEEFEGQGYFGLGLGLYAGMQYRSSRRVGAVLRFDAENSPSMIEGWFYQVQIGLRLFL
jgi:hypothetical protein